MTVDPFPNEYTHVSSEINFNQSTTRDGSLSRSPRNFNVMKSKSQGKFVPKILSKEFNEISSKQRYPSRSRVNGLKNDGTTSHNYELLKPPLQRPVKTALRSENRVKRRSTNPKKFSYPMILLNPGVLSSDVLSQPMTKLTSQINDNMSNFDFSSQN